MSNTCSTLQKKAYFQNSQKSIPIHTIFCIGRNYREHAAELNHAVPTLPMVFLKPLTAIIYHQEPIQLPKMSQEVHHEVELVALIGKTGKHIVKDKALAHIAGYGVGIDLTARDLQTKAKAKGHPWTLAKGFDTFAPLSEFVEPQQITNIQNLDLRLSVNGDIRQSGNTQDMIFPLSELIAYLSGIFTLHPGDLIFTGTPKGVGQIQRGDRLFASLGNNQVTLTNQVQ